MQPVLAVNRVFSFTRLDFLARFCGHFRNGTETDWRKTTKSMSTRNSSWSVSEGESKQLKQKNKTKQNKQNKQANKQTNSEIKALGVLPFIGYIGMCNPNC